ncbi:MAG TPA: hypothetical protein V6C72_06445, partial [Chroococcales cyanobacterium]
QQKQFLLGSFPFISPERLGSDRGLSAGSDIYAIGMILFECLTGTLPLKRSGAYKFGATPLRQATGVKFPPEIEKLVSMIISRDPAARPQSLSELKRLLQSANHSVSAIPAWPSISEIGSRYNIFREHRPQALYDLELIDRQALAKEISADIYSKRRVRILYAVMAGVAALLYTLTIMDLHSISASLSRIGVSSVIASEMFSPPTQSQVKNLMRDTPQIEETELRGSNKLSLALKFCSPYVLKAEHCTGDFTEIANLTKLEILDVNGSTITDRDFKALEHLPLRYVNVNNCSKLTGACLKSLGKIKTLRVLHFQAIPVKETDLTYLNPDLEVLSLAKCGLTNSALPHLVRLKNLVKLYIHSNHLTDESLPYLKQLKHAYAIYLQQNTGISNEKLWQLSQAMPHTYFHYNGWSLNYNYNPRSVTDSLAHCNGYELRMFGADGDFSQVARLTDLQSLLISESTVRDKDFEYFRKLPLRYIEGDRCNITGDGLQHLKKLPNLISIRLDYVPLKAQDLAQLNPQLRELNLVKCKVDDDGVGELGKLTYLTWLRLNDNPITVKSFKALRTLKNLRYLEIHDCRYLTFEQAQELRNNMPYCVVVTNPRRY